MVRGALGCAGGRLVGALLIAACRLVNVGRARRPTDRERALMAAVAPEVPLDRVAIVERARLPIAPGMRAITLGDTIYVRGARLEPGSVRDMSLLLHELVHVRQVAEAGSVWRFLCAYGREWIARLSYEDNPLEVEAREVERSRAAALADAIRGGA